MEVRLFSAELLFPSLFEGAVELGLDLFGETFFLAFAAEDDRLFERIDHQATVVAGLEMFLELGAQSLVDFAVDIVGNILYVFATRFHFCVPGMIRSGFREAPGGP